MATPSAAAALFAAALPKGDGASGSGSTNHPLPGNAPRGRGARGRGRGARAANARRPGASLTDDDVGMSDLAESGASRRGRSGVRAGPMGERPTNGRNRGGRNAPALIRDGGRSSSTPAPSKNEPPSAGTMDTLRLFLLSRYTADARMLNMENLAEDPVLRQANLTPPGQKGCPTSMAGAMWKLAGEMFPNQIVTLSLANNHFTSLLPISPWLLTTHLPNLENVSFANNSLNQFRDLDPFSPLVGKSRADGKQKGWPNLKELVLKGNPMAQEGSGEAEYQRQIARRFATLRTLDQKPLDPAIAFISSAQSAPNGPPGLSAGAKKAGRVKRDPVIFPVPISPGFFDSEGTRDFVGGFLSQFFPAYDNDRPSLLTAYAPICTFSFAADTSTPIRSRAKKIGAHNDKRYPNQYKLDWKHYLQTGPESSRNLLRVGTKTTDKRVKTLKMTASGAISSIMALPKTVHPLSEASKFVFDTWTMPGLLAPTAPGAEGETVIFAVVHGEFSELPTKGLRSFDRTFILAPAPPGSAAQLAGWPCLILSDMLSIRGYSDPIAWQPKAIDQLPPAPAGAVGPAPVVGAPPAQERAEGLTDAQQALVLQLQSVTNLTYAFAHLCLVQNGWDPTTALANFQSLQAGGAIPPEAFLPPRAV